jgi:hypothetical protein
MATRGPRLEILLQLAIGEHLFETTPGGLATFGLIAGALVHTLQKTVVVGGVFSPVQELFVEIEAFVVSFGHCGRGLIFQ